MSQTEVQLIKDAVIVNADVSNSAAIDVSKISGAMPLAGGTFTNDVTFEGAVSGRQILFDRSDNAFKVSDNFNINLGTGNDLQIFHNGSNSFITNISSGGFLHIRSGSGINLQDDTGDENFLKCIDNGAVQLYHDNSLRLATDANGIHVTTNVHMDDNGRLELGTGSDLQIYHNGNHSFIEDSGTGNLFVKTSKLAVENAAGNESLLTATQDGAVELFHNGTKRLDTTSSGIDVTGTIDADDVISVDGSSNVDLRIQTSANNRLVVRGASSLSSIITQNNNNLSLRHDGGTGGGTEIVNMSSTGISIGNNKDILIKDFYGDTSGRIVNCDSGANSLAISVDPDNSGSNSIFLIQIDGNNKARFTSDGFIPNGSDTAAANALDDYEEGTFTPNNTIGMPLTNTHPAQYVKIGQMCWIVMNVIFDSTPSDVSQCGLIQNLPFTSQNITVGGANGEQQLPYFFISENGGTASRDEDESNTVYFIGKNESRVDIFNLAGGTLQTRGFLHGRRMRMNFCYRTA